MSDIATLPIESLGTRGSKRKDQLVWRIRHVLKNRIYQESHTRTCQEVDKFRRICCEETHRAKQIQQERDLTIVSQLLSQIRDLQNQAKSLSEEKECHDPCSPISLEES